MTLARIILEFKNMHSLKKTKTHKTVSLCIKISFYILVHKDITSLMDLRELEFVGKSFLGGSERVMRERMLYEASLNGNVESLNELLQQDRLTLARVSLT